MQPEQDRTQGPHSVRGVIALQGGGPFDRNDDLDRTLLGGLDRVVMLPTADAFEQPRRLVEAAVAWGSRIGVAVEPLMVLTRDEAISRGWFGRVSPDVRPRLGDVVAAAHDSWALMSSADFAYEMTLVGLHGSLTPREMHIPILVC